MWLGRFCLWCSMAFRTTFICLLLEWEYFIHMENFMPFYSIFRICLHFRLSRRVACMAKPCFAATILGWLPHIAILAHRPSKKVIMTGLAVADVSKYDCLVCNYDVFECHCQPMISSLPKGAVCELSSWNEQHLLKTLTRMFNETHKIKFYFLQTCVPVRYLSMKSFPCSKPWSMLTYHVF